MIVSALFDKNQVIAGSIDVYYGGLKGLSCRCVTYFDLDDLEYIVEKCEEFGKEFWLQLNLLYEEKDLEYLKTTLEHCEKVGVKGIVYSSLAVYQLAKEIGYCEVLVYQGDTLITNSYDATLFASKNRAVILANSLTLKEIKSNFKANSNKFGLVVFGHRLLAYSKRKFVSNYFQYLERDFNERHEYRIQEETREYSLPILQEEKTCSVYSANLLDSLVELKELVEHCEYLIIDPIFLNVKIAERVAKTYKSYIDGGLDLKSAKVMMLEYLEYESDSGFYYRKTEKTKEAVEDE